MQELMSAMVVNNSPAPLRGTTVCPPETVYARCNGTSCGPHNLAMDCDDGDCMRVSSKLLTELLTVSPLPYGSSALDLDLALVPVRSAGMQNEQSLKSTAVRECKNP